METPTDQLYQKFKENLDPYYQEIIIKFFLSFSRFEFLLKYDDFIKPDGTVDWDGFTIKKKIDYKIRLDKGITEELQNAIQYINSNPPKKLVKIDGKYLWEDIRRTNIAPLEVLTLHIRTIRNNLFHGNKVLNADNGRDRGLLQCSLLILNDLVTFLDGELNFVEESI